jgi:catechol 2,3-dioxygenase-like lactoylglutathione lyase family enzyme
MVPDPPCSSGISVRSSWAGFVGGRDLVWQSVPDTTAAAKAAGVPVANGSVMAKQQQVGPLGPDVAVTHILVVTDPARSRDFWIDVLGAELYREYGGTSVVLRFAGTWLLLVSGGGPTPDKPTVVLQPPADAGLVSHAMTLRVADCQAVYEALRSRGAALLTPPYDWGSEIRCFLRDPDGHLVEISESKAS